MELKKFPAYPEWFANYKQYRDAQEKFHKEEYLGKTLQFNCELIGNSGNTLHQKGDKVIVRDMDVDCFKLMTVDGEHIYGLFKPSCFEDAKTLTPL